MRVLAYGVMVLSFMISPVMAATASGFVSHKAVYQIDLWKNTSNSSVESVNGKTFYSINKGCDGWYSTEKYAINFIFSEGQTSEFISQYETWESHKGDSFSFSITEDSTYNGRQTHEGYANLFTGYGEASFIGSEEGTVELPSDTVFPVQHLSSLIQQANTGGHVYQTHLFIGGEMSDSQYFVSSLIGKAKHSPPRIDLGHMADDKYWPLRVAYFDPTASDAEPEYEIEFMVQENGVIRSYIVDYGDFSMRAIMESFDPLNDDTC